MFCDDQNTLKKNIDFPFLHQTDVAEGPCISPPPTFTLSPSLLSKYKHTLSAKSGHQMGGGDSQV